MRIPIAVLTGAAVLAPALGIAHPAEAASPRHPVITNCAMTKHGVMVRIKVRDEGRKGMAVRVSHARADGNFFEPRVKATRTGIYRESRSAPDRHGNEIGSAVSLEPAGSKYSFRTGPADYLTVVGTTFKLRGGKKIKMSCTLR